METQREALDRAIELAGGVIALAKHFNIDRQAVYGWKDRNRVPANRCADIELLTSGAVTAEMLRPDVFK